MPYDNPYNKRVAEEVQSTDERYILNLDRQYEMPLFLRGSGSSGGRSSSAPVGFNDSFDDKMIQNVLKGGCGMCGGSGFGKMTMMDTGFDTSLGSAEVKNFRPNTNNTGGMKTMKKENPKLEGCAKAKRGRKSKMGAGLMDYMPIQDRIARPDEAWKQRRDKRFQPKEEIMIMEGSGTKELKDDLNKFDFNRIKDYIGMAKPKDMMALKKHLKMTGSGWEEFKKDLGSFDFNKVKSWIGLGKYGKANTKRMMGAGFWDDFKRGFNMVFEPASKYLLKPLATATGAYPITMGLSALGYGKNKMGEGVGYGKNWWDEEIMKVSKGSGTKELKDDVNKFDWNRIKDYIGMAKPKDMMALKKHIGLTGAGWEEFKKDLGSFDFNKVKSWIGLGKYGKANSKRMMGAGWWDSFTNFFKKFPEKMNEIIMPIASKINETVGTVRGAIGLGKSGGKKAPSAKQLEARRKFTEMVRAKSMKNKL
jgi:hypothetical protein